MLDHTHPSYKASLGSLDRLPTRFCNTVFVLYCREGCSKPEDILSQQVSEGRGGEEEGRKRRRRRGGRGLDLIPPSCCRYQSVEGHQNLLSSCRASAGR